MKVHPLADDYGEVVVAVSFTCRIEQFVNFMTRRWLAGRNCSRPTISGWPPAIPRTRRVIVRSGALRGRRRASWCPAKKGPGAALGRRLIWRTCAAGSGAAGIAVNAAGIGWTPQWLDAQADEQAVLLKRLRPAPAPPVSPLPAFEPARAAGYNDIAQKMLFSKDRNPEVVVEAPPPPRPKPMPPCRCSTA